MPQGNESKRGGHGHIGVGDAVDRQRREQTFVAAIKRLESAIDEMPVAVIDRIATGIGGDQQCLIPIAVKQGRQGMRLMVVVENYFGAVAEATGTPELVDLEYVVDVCRVIAQKFFRHVAPGAPLDIFPIFLPYPAHAADIAIENSWKFAAAETRNIDILACFPGDRQNLVDGEVGMIASVAFKAGQPLELNGGEQMIVLE